MLTDVIKVNRNIWYNIGTSGRRTIDRSDRDTWRSTVSIGKKHPTAEESKHYGKYLIRNLAKDWRRGSPEQSAYLASKHQNIVTSKLIEMSNHRNGWQIQLPEAQQLLLRPDQKTRRKNRNENIDVIYAPARDYRFFVPSFFHFYFIPVCTSSCLC